MNSDNQSHDDASVQVLSGILKDIGAIECLAAVVEDHDDDALKTLSKLKPERIASKFGMALNKAIAFVGKCLEASASYGLTGRGAAMSSSSPSPSASAPTVLPACPAGDAAIVRALDLEMIRGLGKGGFRTVCESQNLAERLKVADSHVLATILNEIGAAEFADIKLADFGLAKVMDQESLSTSFMLTNASTVVGVVKGTMWYLSPEALQGASSGYERTYSDDIWSVCLVIYEMDTGLSLQQLMTAPGAIKLEELLTKTSRELLPLLASVLAVPDAASRCKSAAELLQKLDASVDPLYIWEEYDATAGKYVCMHHAATFFLETAFLANEPIAQLPLQHLLDLHFDIRALLSSATALGSATERRSGAQRAIRRLLKPSVLTSSCEIPIWQQLVDGKEWLQCPPATCAKLETNVGFPALRPTLSYTAASYCSPAPSAVCSCRSP
jgi:serine/threonine protein kinase